MSQKNHKAVCLWSFCLFQSIYFFSTMCLAQALEEAPIATQNTGLFESSDVLELSILSDFSAIMNDRGDERSYHKGMLYFLNSEKDTVFWDLKLRTRGNFRRNPENCKYPPIMVKFGKSSSDDGLFDGQKKLKLVTQCQLEDYVLLEYLAYKIYNILTDYSYRVRLAHVTYRDIQSREAYFARFAFFIESTGELKRRINAETYKKNVTEYYLAADNISMMAMFQYMIGNNDWSVRSKHNVSILKLTQNDELVAIPYDFDWSDFVDANYTKPEDVPDYLLKERQVYQGICLSNDLFRDQQQLFNSNKDSINLIMDSMPHLKKHHRNQSIKYIEKFYKKINSSSALKSIFQGQECIKD